MLLFISFAHTDLQKVEEIARYLRQSGHTPWFDEGLVAGRDWKDQLREKIEAADVFVYALSPRSVASEWCQWEFAQAVKLGKPVVPVLLETTDLPPVLADIQYADFTQADKNIGLNKLHGGLSQIAQLIPKESPISAPENPQGKPERTITNITAGAGSVVVTGGSGDQTNIGTQNVTHNYPQPVQPPPKEPRNWTLPVILGLVIAALGLVVTVIAILPETQRNNILYSVGLIRASDTPTPLPTWTPTLTPTTTPTPTLTPTVTLTPTEVLSVYDIGIAVSYFTVPNDLNIDQAEVDALVRGFTIKLRSELNATTSSLGQSIGLYGPEGIPPVEGSDPPTRATNAARIAKEKFADILVYGTIERNSDTQQLEIKPEFYIAPTNFWEALEMTGSQRLGAGIKVDEPLSDALEPRGALTLRTKALANILTGVLKYIADDYSGAQASFEAVANDQYWEETPGSEVLNILLGNTHLKLAQETAMRCQTATEAEQRQTILDEIASAKAQYDAARQRSEKPYSRAFAGLASATFLESLWSSAENGCNPVGGDPELLQQASDYLDEARRVEDPSLELGVRMKSVFTRAQVAFFQWYGGAPDADSLYQAIMDNTDSIINAYDDGSRPELTLLLAEAYSLRGSAMMSANQCFDAIHELDKALDTKGLPPIRRMFFTGWQAWCYAQVNNNSEAAAKYDEAYQMALAIGSEAADDADYFRSERDALLATPAEP